MRQFAVLTRVLDGHGLKTDSGNHGQRGYAGDYLFSCLGCTTPFDEKVWDTMAQLGSRLFFLTMEAKQAATTEALVAALQGTPYKEQLGICQRYVTEFFSPHKGRCPEHGQDGCPARSVQWNKEKDSGAVLVWIARMAELVAAMRVCRRRKRSSAKVTLRVNPILNRAMEWKYLKANPAHGVRGAKEAPGRVRYLSAEERDTLLNGADVTVKAKDGRTWTVRRVPNPALRLYILAALQTGARRGEVLALRWADVGHESPGAHLPADEEWRKPHGADHGHASRGSSSSASASEIGSVCVPGKGPQGALPGLRTTRQGAQAAEPPLSRPST